MWESPWCRPPSSSRSSPKASASGTSPRAFRNHLSDDWIETDASPNDFGWDYWISLRDPDRKVGRDFFVQLKGSTAPDIVDGGQALTRELKVSTINFLHNRACPAMLAVCDVKAPDRPVYWVWLDEALQLVGEGWQTQKTVTLRVPKSQVLRESHARIEAEARRYHQELAVSDALRDAVAVAIPEAVREPTGELPTPSVARERTLRVFAAAGIVDLGQSDADEPTLVSEPERRIRAILEEAKLLLDSYADSRARAKLRDAEMLLRDTEVAPRTLAKLHNRHGVLALRELRPSEAVGHFKKALEYALNDIGYECNLITAEALLDEPPKSREEYVASIDRVLARSPDSEQAITIRTRLVGRVDSAAAEAFLRASPLWVNKLDEAKLLLADILSSTDLRRALEVLDEVGGDAADGAQAWSLRGLLLMAGAIGLPAAADVTVRGFGPARLDLALIKKAAEAYSTACDRFAAMSYPRISGEVFRSAAQALFLAGRPREAIRRCEEYLHVHPSSPEVLEAVSIALTAAGRSDAAVEYLVRCVELEPSSEGAFRNLLLALYGAGQHSTLYERCQDRLRLGPLSPDEELTCREFAALAAAELGRHEEAQAHLDVLAARDEPRAASVSATVWSRAGRQRSEILDMVRAASARFPSDPSLASHLVGLLTPISAMNAAEVVELLEQRVAPQRQLSHQEASWIGRALSALGYHDRAEATLRHAVVRFPEDARLAFDYAVTLAELGRSNEAYEVMRAAAERQKPSADVQQNLAVLASETGRLNQAIDLFEQAAARAGSDAERRALRGQVFELRRRRGDSAKELLRAATLYGQSTRDDPECEARFVMMCLLAGTGSLDLEDPEIKQWTADGSARLQEFCDKHPKHAALRRFRLPEGVKGEQLVNFIVSELLAETYPALLAGQQLEIASRGAPYPLSVRARLLPSVGTGVLTYWEHCVRHDDAAHRIHCLISPETLAAEKEAVPEHGEPLVVDITALLTMHLLGVLDEVLDYFGQFVLTSDTKEAIEAEAYGIPMPVQRARQLDDWMASKRGRVAIRRRTRRRQRYDPYAQTAGGVWMRKEPDLPEILTDGVGSSVLLASELKTPLYSDEALVRQWAGDEFQVRCFGIVALMAALRERRNLGLEAEARLVAILLESHYRDVPFGSEHLHAAIHELAGRASARNASELNSDPTTGALLRMLGEPAVAPEAVRNVGAATIAACVRDGSLPTDTVDAVAQTISFKIQQRTAGGVLIGSNRADPLSELAGLWALTLLYLRRCSGDVARAWRLMLGTVERLYGGNPRFIDRAADFTAARLIAGLKGVPTFDDDERTRIALEVAQGLPEDGQRVLFRHIDRAFRPAT